MSIILQHEFWDLAPGETFFSVTLKFAGQDKRLSIPYTAVTRFIDPSVQFALQFEPPEVEPARAPCPSPRPSRRRSKANSRPSAALRRAQSGLARPVQKEVTP